MVDEACLPRNAYYPRTPDYTLYSGVNVCWSEHSDSSFVYGFMSLDYGLGTMTETTLYPILIKFALRCIVYQELSSQIHLPTESFPLSLIQSSTSKISKNCNCFSHTYIVNLIS